MATIAGKALSVTAESSGMATIAGKALSVTVRGHEKRQEDGKVLYTAAFDADGGGECLGERDSVLRWECQKRYSEFDDLRAALEKLHGAQITALPFPRKELLVTEETVRAREMALEAFLQAAVRTVTPVEQSDGSAASVLYQFLVGGERGADSPLPSTAASRSTVLIFENQRAGGLGDALTGSNPSEDRYTQDKLMAIDPTPWSSPSGCERPPPEVMSRYPMPGWRWAPDTKWRQGPWEYRANFIGAAGTEDAIRDWETQMSTRFGNKSWVRRRRLTRAVERDPNAVWSGRLEKRKLAGSDHRWFVVTRTALCYYQLEHADDSYDDLGAPVVPPAAAANGGVIPFKEIKAIVTADGSIAEDTFKVQLNTGREIFLRAGSSGAVELWARKIQEAAGNKWATSVPEAEGTGGAGPAAQRAPEGEEHPVDRDIILCAAVGVRTGADDWLAPEWTDGAAVVLTPHHLHVFDRGPPFWWDDERKDGTTAQMIRSLKLTCLQMQPADPRTVAVEEACQSAEKSHELRLHTMLRENCMRLAFETRHEREEWAAEIVKAVDKLGAPVAPAAPAVPLLPSNEKNMPA